MRQFCFAVIYLQYLAKLIIHFPMPCLPCVLQCDIVAGCVVSACAVFNTIIEMFPNMRVSVYTVYIEPTLSTLHLAQQSINMSMQVSPVTTTSMLAATLRGTSEHTFLLLHILEAVRTNCKFDCKLSCCLTVVIFKRV